MMPLQPRQRLLLLALAAAALAALASAGPQSEPLAPVAAPPGRAATPADGAPPAEAALARRTTAALQAPLADLADPGRAFQEQPLPEAADAFQPRNWQPPPAPPKPAPAAKPVAPPLPFAYVGRMEEAGAVTVYLRRGEEVVIAQPQKAIDGAYRLEQVAPDRLVFLYLPLHELQVLSLGAPR
jgi:hypothetical protein